MRALVLGATGAVGRVVAAELSRSPEVDELTLAARHEGRLKWLLELLGDDSSRLSARAFNLRDERARERHFGELAPDLIISCAGPARELEVDCARTAVKTGASWLSAANDHSVAEAVRALDPAAIEAGVTVVSGCGLSPGLTNLLATLAARELDEIQEVEIAVARSARDPAGEAALTQLLVALSGPAPSISEGQRTIEPAPKPHLVYFPEPVGWVETFSGASPELSTLVHKWPLLRLLRWRVGMVEKPAMDALRLLSAGPWASHWAGWRALAGRALGQSLGGWPSHAPGWSAARVDLRGRSGPRSHSVSYGVADHLVNLTAVPLVAAAFELSSERTEPGVRAPEEAFDAGALLLRVSRRGVRIARLEPYDL